MNRVKLKPAKRFHFPKGLMEVKSDNVAVGNNVCRLHPNIERHPATHAVRIKGKWLGLCCKHYNVLKRFID